MTRASLTHYSLTLLLSAAGLAHVSSVRAQGAPPPPVAPVAPTAPLPPATAPDSAPAVPAPEAPAPPPPAAPPPSEPATTQGGLLPAPVQEPAPAQPPAPVQAQPAPPAAPPPYTPPLGERGVPAHLEDPVVISGSKPERVIEFYAALSAFGVLGGHNSVYRFNNPRPDQDTPLTTRDESLRVTGWGYDLTALVGITLDGLGLGGAIAFTQYPNAKADYGDTTEDDVFGDDYVDYRRPLWTLLVGPGMDFRPVAPLRLGGMVGVAVANVPEFEYQSRHQETIVGGGVDGWVGAEFPVASHYRLSLLGKLGIRQYKTRDVATATSVGNSETGAFLGVGFGFAYVTPREGSAAE